MDTSTKKHYTQICLLTGSNEEGLETRCNDRLKELMDKGYTISDIKFAMADDVAHQILIIYET